MVQEFVLAYRSWELSNCLTLIDREIPVRRPEDNDRHRRLVRVILLFLLPRPVGLLQRDERVTDFRIPPGVTFFAGLNHRLHCIVVRVVKVAVVFSGKHFRVVLKSVERRRYPFSVPVASELCGIDAPGSAGDGVALSLIAESASPLVEGLITQVTGQPCDCLGRDQNAGLACRRQGDKDHCGDRRVLAGVGPRRGARSASRQADSAISR